jgi:hypothetical protein
MKTESLMLISDARQVWRKTLEAEAKSNPLAGAFLGWLLPSDDLVALLKAAADRAAAAAGGGGIGALDYESLRTYY